MKKYLLLITVFALFLVVSARNVEATQNYNCFRQCHSSTPHPTASPLESATVAPTATPAETISATPSATPSSTESAQPSSTESPTATPTNTNNGSSSTYIPPVHIKDCRVEDCNTFRVVAPEGATLPGTGSNSLPVFLGISLFLVAALIAWNMFWNKKNQ